MAHDMSLTEYVILSKSHLVLYACALLTNFKRCRDLALTGEITNSSFLCIQITFQDFRECLVIGKRKSSFGKKGGNLMFIPMAVILFLKSEFEM